MLSLLLFCYFLNLMYFSFIFNPIMCSILLMVNASISSLVIYIYCGTSWYPLLISMVYLGGVYIIILFISSHIQNDQITNNNITISFLALLGLLLWGVWEQNEISVSSVGFGSEYLVNVSGLGVFLLLTFILLFMFYLITLISCSKSGFLR
uniref:NADH dehydrogenase subunit 6 n=1 Tax=Heterobothrium okamotoi TaxID=263722 RepID=A0A7U0R6Y9_9PLAT|nr:NADH dehydrogenase subunit 6 [Heterobothrium okamotoi]QQX28221.1 NADH dehydrogenase subunit 6 [Heterobothrium okamotoi]